MNQTKHQHSKPVFSLSEEPPLKRQKLADTSASSSMNEKKIQSSSNEQCQYYLTFRREQQQHSYNIVNPVTTPQISFADIYSLQRLTKQYPAIQGGHS